MRREEYLYVLKNKDYSEWITKNQLPGKDDQVFVNGILEKAFLSEEELKKLNKVIKYEKGIYYKNQIVLDADGTGEKNEFELSQPGWYEIAISAAGGKTKDVSKNFLNDEGKVLYWKRENTALSCFIKFYEDFTWLLVDQIGGSDENGVYNCRKGTFLLSEKILILNQTHVSSMPIEGFKKESAVVPEETPTIKDWNEKYSMAGSDVFVNNKNKIDAIDWAENNVEMFDYAILFFNYKTDGNLSIFRKLSFTKNLKNIFSAQNTGNIKEYLSFYDTDDKSIYLKDLIYKNENYYYITKAMSFMEKEPRNSVFGINGEDYLKAGALQSVNGFEGYDEKEIPFVYNNKNKDKLDSTIIPGYRKDNTEILKWLEVDSNGEIIDKTDEDDYKTGSWSIKNFPNGIPNTNISPAGDGGYFRFYININEKKTLEYLVGKKYDGHANAGGQGSYLKIKEDADNYVFVGGGGLAYEKETDVKYLGGYSTIGNNQDVLNGGGSIANRINNNKDYVEYTGTVSLGGGCLSEKNDFKTNTDINEEIDQSIGPSYKEGGKTNTLQDLHGKTSSQFLGSENHVNVSLGGFGSGIFKNTEWLCTYRKPENGKLSVRFLGPPSSQVYNVNYTYTKKQGAPNGTGRIAYIENNIEDKDTWCQVDLVEGTNVPAGTPMNIRFFHSNSDKEIKVELKMWQDGQFESPEAEEKFKNNPDNWISYEDTFNPEVFLDSKYISFKKDRISNNIEELSFTTINKHILFRFTIIPRLFKIRVFGEDSDEIIKYEFSAERENPENPSEIQTKGHDEVLNFGVEEGYKVTLKVWYRDRDRGLNRSDIIYLSSLYEGHNTEKISGNLVTFDYDQNERVDSITFMVPRHDIKIDLTPVDVYKLEMKAMNTISKPAQNGLPPLVDAKILSIFVGYDINNMTQYDSAVDIEVNADQQIFVKLVFTTERIRIDEDLTSFPPGTIVEKAGNSLTSSESAEIEQWFYFSMPRYSVSIPLYVELRTFLLNIKRDRHNILEIRSSSGLMEFEVGEKVNLEFDIEKKYKLSEDSGVTINGTTYLLDGKVLSKKQFNVEISGIRNTLDIGKDTHGNSLGVGNYYTDFCENSRAMLEDIETVYINFVMQNNDVDIYFCPNFLLNSTIIDCKENENKTFKAVNAGFYRLILAGCRTGNGGDGSDGGARNTNEDGISKNDNTDVIFSGLPGGRGGEGFFGGNGGRGSNASPWELKIIWETFLGFIPVPVGFRHLKGCGGGGGLGGNGFFGGKGSSGGTAGWVYSASGQTGYDGHSFLAHGHKAASLSSSDYVNTFGPKGKTNYSSAPHQDTTNKFIKYRGAIIDCILFLNEGQFLTAVGSSGGDGGDGPPAKQHYCGAGGGGGGSGGEAIFAPKSENTAFFCVENFKTKVFNDVMANRPFQQNAVEVFSKTNSNKDDYISKRKNGTFVISIQNSEKYFPIKALGGENGCYSTFSFELTDDNIIKVPNGKFIPFFHPKPSLAGHNSNNEDNVLSNVNKEDIYSQIPTVDMFPSDTIISNIENKFNVGGNTINVGGGAYPTIIESGAEQYWKSFVKSKALKYGRLPLSGRSGNHLVIFNSYGGLDANGGNVIYTKADKIRNAKFSLQNKLDYAYRVGMFLGADFIPNDSGGIKIIYVGDYSDKIINTASSLDKLETNISIKELTECTDKTYTWWEIDNIPYF